MKRIREWLRYARCCIQEAWYMLTVDEAEIEKNAERFGLQ
jgi:hypothetical protein